jgi:4-amino-4-deoxy-L-arabinose transferase-like glycosyltransferase
VPQQASVAPNHFERNDVIILYETVRWTSPMTAGPGSVLLDRSESASLRFIVLLMIAYLVASSVHLALNVRSAEGAATLVSSDSGHYLDFAHRFAAGNFTMDYIREVPHRQPLYPLLLAAAMKIGSGNLFFLGLVNVIAMTLTIGSVYFGVFRFFRRSAVAAISALCVALNPFFWRIAAARLLTEPIYALVLVWVAIAFLQYLREGKLTWLLLGSAFAGLAYLTKPSGVFVQAASLGVLFLAEFSLPWRFRNTIQPRLNKAIQLIPKYLAAAFVFIVVTSPAWIARLVYFGDPQHYGYLTNFLWIDTYHLAHDVDQRFPNFTWHDYVAHHNFLDVIFRLIYGLLNVGFTIPIFVEKAPILFLFAVAGVWTTIWKGPAEYRFFLLFFVVQLLPFIWTNMPNPNMRVPYGSTLPFEPFFAARFLARYSTRLDAALGRWLGFAA